MTTRTKRILDGIDCSIVVVEDNEACFDENLNKPMMKNIRENKELKIMRMEIRPQEGGKDAELFVEEFAGAVAKHSGKNVSQEGTMRFLERL